MCARARSRSKTPPKKSVSGVGTRLNGNETMMASSQAPSSFPSGNKARNETSCSMMGMRAAQRKLRDLLHTLSYEPRESLLQVAGLGASRVEKILQKCEEVGRPLGVQDVLGIPRMGPGTVGSLVGDPLLPAVVKYVLYYQKVVGQNKCTPQEVGR